MNKDFVQLTEELNSSGEIRQVLSRVRADIKDNSIRAAFIDYLGGNEEILIHCLGAQDNKARKNAALLIGDIGEEVSLKMRTKLVEALMKAYSNETQNFVKSSYLEALKVFDYTPYIKYLEEKLAALQKEIPKEEDIKHKNNEIHAIEELLLKGGIIKGHEFNGENVSSEIVMTCNRGFAKVLYEKIMTLDDTDIHDVRTFSAGVILSGKTSYELRGIRIYREILFRVPDMLCLPGDCNKAIAIIAKAHLYDYIAERHEKSNQFPFAFRIEMKSAMDNDKRNTFLKQLSMGIEKAYNRKLINNTSHYEIELRLIETKTGSFNCLLKMYTMKDNRFSYRCESTAASLRPDNAALIVELSKDYMKENANVLDPFCGTGTLLIERYKTVKAKSSYGVDIFGEAVKKARINAAEAGQIIHFINRDFFSFEHDYEFDEIITDMPFSVSGGSEELLKLYERFFGKAREILSEDGIIIMYTHNGNFVRKNVKAKGYNIVKHFIINEKSGSELYILNMQ